MKKKIYKLLNKKVTVASALWIVAFLTTISIMILLHKNTYSYVDFNDNVGTSNECYYDGNDRQIKCLHEIPVKQYYER